MDKQLFKRIVDLLLPDMKDPKARKALITSALYGSPALELIDWDGDTRTFTTELVQTLGNFEESTLAELLKETQSLHGKSYKKTVEHILQQLDKSSIEKSENESVKQDPPNLKNWATLAIILLFIGIVAFLVLKPESLETATSIPITLQFEGYNQSTETITIEIERHDTLEVVRYRVTVERMSDGAKIKEEDFSASETKISISTAELSTGDRLRVILTAFDKYDNVFKELTAALENLTIARTIVTAPAMTTSPLITSVAMLTQSIAIPTFTPFTPVSTPTDTPTNTPTPTPDLIKAAQQLLEQQTAQALIDAATATAVRANEIETQIYTRDLTAWQVATETENARQSTTTAEAWTDTPTAKSTFTMTPILSPAEQMALTSQPSNAAWKSNVTEREFDGVVMVLVPAGCFIMGSEVGASDEKPVSEQCIDTPYWISKYEVTLEQYGVLPGGSQKSDNHPKDFITWFEAKSFCASHGGQLPTELEWEYAARGPNNLIYPWGDIWDESKLTWRANLYQESDEVGTHLGDLSWVGAQDMAGNVSEWTRSVYRPYPYNAAQEDDASSSSLRYVVRGGAWTQGSSITFQLTNRHRYLPKERDIDIGFRCVRSLQ